MEQIGTSSATTTIDIPDDVNNTSEEKHLIPKVSLSKYIQILFLRILFMQRIKCIFPARTVRKSLLNAERLITCQKGWRRLLAPANIMKISIVIYLLLLHIYALMGCSF